jgi:NAD(P)-dependent dehydrogenase (short-subunit alcohol dehydrogenase family)
MDSRGSADQVAIVTGGGRGIGRAIAQALAADGAKVVVAARTPAQVEETATLIHDAGGEAAAFAVDVTDVTGVNKMVAAVEKQWGAATLLVNNAAVIGAGGPIWETDTSAWWRTLEINLKGPYLCAQAVLPGMIERGRGRIVNVASKAGLFPITYGAAYAVSKAALIRFSENLATETRQHGIAVFAIHPGDVRTAMADYLMTEEVTRWMPWTVSLFENHSVLPERAAQLVLALASGEADALSGCFISIDDDLAGMIQRAGEIQQESLHTLRLKTGDQ